MIDLEAIEAEIDDAIGCADGQAPLQCSDAKEIIDRLRQAEKDAARYRWLRDLPEGSAHEEIGNYPGDMWDAAIDEAMQCK